MKMTKERLVNELLYAREQFDLLVSHSNDADREVIKLKDKVEDLTRNNKGLNDGNDLLVDRNADLQVQVAGLQGTVQGQQEVIERMRIELEEKHMAICDQTYDLGVADKERQLLEGLICKMVHGNSLVYYRAGDTEVIRPAWLKGEEKGG